MPQDIVVVVVGGWGSERDKQTDADNSTLRLVVGFVFEEHEVGERRDEMGLAMQFFVGHLKYLCFILRAVGSH